MNIEKYVIGIKFALQSLFSSKVDMTANEAYEYLNTINLDVKSSCWTADNVGRVCVWGGTG